MTEVHTQEPDTDEAVDAEAVPETDLATTAEQDTALAQTNPLSIIRQVASDPNCDVEKLERLMALQERWEANEARRAFGEALAKFQSKVPIIQKNRTAQGAKMSFNYAGLDDIMVAIRPLLAECGLSISFSSDQTSEGNLHITVTLQHGTHCENREFTCPIPTEMRVNQTQKMGAALSYARRYALCGALNIIVSDEDLEPPPSDAPEQDPDAPEARTRGQRAAVPSMKDAAAAALTRWWPYAKAQWIGETDEQLVNRFRQYVNHVATCEISGPSAWTPKLVADVNAALDASNDPRPPEPNGSAE